MMDDFIKQFDAAPMGELLRLRKNVFLPTAEVLEVLAVVREHGMEDPLFAGELMGKEENGFIPSFQLLDRVNATAQKVVVNDDAAYLFTCGRDILGKGIQHELSSEYSGMVLVQNKEGETLGYGKVVGKLAPGDHVAVKNMLDRGDFLRREGIRKR